jgi:F420-non-reducing hydrogenase large subunit
MAHYIHSHHAHFYALAAPDLLIGARADPAKRNVLGIIEKVGLEIGKQVLEFRRLAQEAQGIIGGRFTHLVWCIPGGVTKHLTKEDVAELKIRAKRFIELTEFTIKIFNDLVLGNPDLVELIVKGPYELFTHQMGLVDKNNKVNFYDGMVRVVGKEICKYKARDYRKHVAEHVEEWSYLKFPYLKARGWKGFVDGMDSGVYCATPLSRLNVSDGMATPKAQEEYERMYATLGGKPVHKLMANHWARLVEMMYAAEKFMEYVNDPDITDDNVHKVPTKKPNEGVGIVEAMRGTLTHHYKTDENGIVTKANLIVGTTNNNAAINIAIKNTARAVIQKGKEVTEGILNMIEMSFRAFDPCFSCATHYLPGKMPMIVNIYDKHKNLLQTIRRDV